MAVIIRTRQELIDHVADITGRRDIITEAMEALDNWQGLTPSQQAATEKFLNLPPTTEPEPEPEPEPVAPAATVDPNKWAAHDAEYARWERVAEAYGKAICIHTGEPVKNWTNLPLYPYADDDGSSGFLQISCEGNGIPSTQNDELWYKIDDEANKILGTRMGDGLYWNETQNAASIHVFKD